ncbi:MAG: hypothetical protein ACQGVC_24190 [Myxococcota bacterium]
MANPASTRLQWVRDELAASAEELAVTVEQLPEAWREAVGADLERLVADARLLTRSVGEALAAQRAAGPHEPHEPDKGERAA